MWMRQKEAANKNSCCVDPGCSHALLSAASKEACKLSVAERQIILGVLKRNEQVQKDQHYRIMRLKAELQILRRKGALKTSADYDSTCPDPDRSCGRCRIELGRVINRGAYCRACRLKVCKGCREYSFKTTDWVCTVCHKHMEIQAASGEWMNEFVRRPSRRRDNRVYVPAADIIKRTIRRSWTISNPTSRWNAVRGSPEVRPYNSLPRGQDISNYPSLAVHQTNAKNTSRSPSPSKPPRKHSPAKRSHSEDVYNERETPKNLEPPKSPRVNPLIKYASTERKHQKQQPNDSESDNSISDKDIDLLKKNKRKLQHAKSEVVEGNKQSKQCLEVSMSVDTGKDKVFEKRVSFSNDEEDGNKGKVDGEGAGSPDVPIELCDIEPISGTVFRKVTVRRRRQEMRKMPATDAGTRLDILLPEGDDYKLVFISSDSSSKEEDPDDNDSSSASSFPIDECDWDYFEPGGKVNFSDVVECVHQKEVVKERCERCGGSTQYVPVPVPVPIPVPVHSWSPVLGSMEVLRAQLRVLPRVLWPYLNQAAVMWAGEDEKMKELGVVGGYLESESRCEGSSSSSDDDDEKSVKTRSYTVNISDEDEQKGDGFVKNKIFNEDKVRPSRSYSEKGIRKSKSFSVNSDGHNHSDGVRKSRSYCDDGARKHKTHNSDNEKLKKRTHNLDNAVNKSRHENEVEKMFNYFLDEVRKNTNAGRKSNYFDGLEKVDRIYTTSEGSNSNDGYDLTISDHSEKGRDSCDEGRKLRNLSESDRSEDKNYDTESDKITKNDLEEFSTSGNKKYNRNNIEMHKFKSEDFALKTNKNYRDHNETKERDFTSDLEEDSKIEDKYETEVVDKHNKIYSDDQNENIKHIEDEKNNGQIVVKKNNISLDALNKDTSSARENKSSADKSIKSKSEIKSKKTKTNEKISKNETVTGIDVSDNIQLTKSRSNNDVKSPEDVIKISEIEGDEISKKFAIILREDDNIKIATNKTDGIASNYEIKSGEDVDNTIDVHKVVTDEICKQFRMKSTGKDGEIKTKASGDKTTRDFMMESLSKDDDVKSNRSKVVENDITRDFVMHDEIKMNTNKIFRDENTRDFVMLDEIKINTNKNVRDENTKYFVMHDEIKINTNKIARDEITRDFVMKPTSQNEEVKINRSKVIGEETARDFVMKSSGKNDNIKMNRSKIVGDEITRDFVMKSCGKDDENKINTSKFVRDEIKRDFVMKSSGKVEAQTTRNFDKSVDINIDTKEIHLEADGGRNTSAINNVISQKTDNLIASGKSDEFKGSCENKPVENVNPDQNICLNKIIKNTSYDIDVEETDADAFKESCDVNVHTNIVANMNEHVFKEICLIDDGKINTNIDVNIDEKAFIESCHSDDIDVSKNIDANIVEEAFKNSCVKDDINIESIDAINDEEEFDVVKAGRLINVDANFDEDDFKDGSISCNSDDDENMSISDDSDFKFERCRSYIVNASDDDDNDEEVKKVGKRRSYAINDSDDGEQSFSEESDDSSTSSDCSGSNDDDDEGVSEKKRRKYSRVYVVNSDGDDGDEEEGVVLKRMKSLDEAVIVGDKSEYMSSPGLSDVSAESLSSSDVELSCDKRAAVGEWNESASVGIRSVGAVTARGDGVGGEPAGVSAVVGEQETSVSRHAAARYTSLVMITQDSAPSYAPVSVVTSDTTTLVADGEVVVRHTNWNQNVGDDNNKSAPARSSPVNGFYSLSDKQSEIEDVENVTVITGADTLSAVVCLEEGLADDDSWVETISHDDEDDFCASTNEDSSSGEEVTLHCTAAIDHEDELRGYHRSAIDFTLHTIVEESCEESEVETTSNKKTRPTSATDLEKYFYFGLGDGNSNNPRDDQFSETSSICSESMDSFPGTDDVTNNESTDPAELASSRLEKYFLTGFTSFKERRDSDGSVGSDSEGRPSPEQRRKRLVRARGTGRSHSSSLDNLISNPEFSSNEQPENQNSEDSSSSDTDTYDDSNNFEKIDGQFDTVKRKKCKKQNKPNSPSEELKELNEDAQSEEDGHKTPQPINIPENIRDSGFIGSNDDLNKDPEPAKQETQKTNLYNIQEEKKEGVIVNSTPPATLLTRKDSFNNWSSDEETNLMMSKMRQFFKTMVNVNAPKNQNVQTPGKPTPSPRLKNRHKPPQLVYFENELTRLMKTVPGIRDDQVREIVEYLSSEDTWSDSYDSSDYTSSDLENSTVTKSVLQQQISDSCKQIINKFDSNSVEDEEGDEGDGGIVDETHGLNRETAFVYQKLIASFDKMATGEEKSTPHNSPPLIAKVMHHIGSRLVALMHEVSSGESHASNSPKNRHYHKRLQQKLSNASTTTTEDDDSISECNLENLSFNNNNNNNLLPRSRSHDLLLSEKSNFQTSTNDTNEEREVSDCERFSWRGSFESALLATDSRNKLSEATSSSALALAAKRRSAGDLLFTHKSLSREQLDRVRSCGSIGGANPEEKIWARPSRRRSSVPDASCGSGGSADDEDDLEQRSTLPRSLQTGTATTNSLPRLPTNTQTSNIQKAQSMYHFLQQGVKSARYRPPGFNRLIMSAPKRAVSAPGLQPTPQRRGRRQQTVVPSDDVSLSEAHSSPMLASRTSKSASPSPVAHKSKRAFGGSQEWNSNEDDIDRLVSIHHTRSSLSNLGVQSHFNRVSRSDSMASVYSGAGEGRYGTVAVKGQVEFGLQYNYKTAALEINVKQCKDLAAVDAKRSRSDPYVKVYLLPDKSKSGKRKTKVKKHTLNPVFDECLKFHISLNGLETRTLWLTVWHSDMFGRNDFLGEVMMTLENKVFDDPTPKWYNLEERTEPFDDMLSFKGDILVGLKFVPPDMTVHKKGKRSRGALHVLVKEAKSLTAVKANGTSDPFCKSYLLPDKGRSGKQKTSVVRRTTNPVWNHTFVYDDVTLQELAERCLELTVWDHDRLASNEFLGGVRFSLGTGKHYGKLVDWMDATGKEMTLWKSMLERPNFWVEGCLSLRPTLDHRTTS